MRIFFAGPLTGLKNPEVTKKWYRDMAGIANKNGFECFWAFMSGTDPVKDPGVDPEYIYNKDLAELENSNLMIAYVGEPSPGTGQELEYAHEHNIPAYLMYAKSDQVSRMILGNPTVVESIVFTDFEDALNQLDELLQKLAKRVNV
jgi:2'-deoxynucleoside 5'-phosphate N-hydrolase